MIRYVCFVAMIKKSKTSMFSQDKNLSFELQCSKLVKSTIPPLFFS